MMHRRNKQQGFIIISMMVVFGFLSLAGIQWAKFQEKRNVQANAESFYHHVLHLRKQIHAYTANQFQKGIGINQSSIFPSRLASLVPEFYASCSTADNEAGRCKPYNQTPWGQINDSDYRLVGVGGTPSRPDFYRAELDIKLPPASDDAYKYERAATLSLFSKIPSIVFDEVNNLITLRIDRPDKAFAYDGLVKRSGDDSTLLGDWDVGGLFAITNSKDVTLAASDGSQILLSQQTRAPIIAKHGDWVDKPACIIGQVPMYQLAISKIEIDDQTHEFTAGMNAYLLNETATQWQVGISIQAKNLSSGVHTVLTTGEALLLPSCR
ncbi:Tfp pilus assembly protein FimT/FimU [Vibrio sp. 10N.261.46.E12]|uniref:pilus assembly FimT family protein n=1 Tax=unclassified Vibrio TaxID=2614977 RepID=UPI000C81DF0E|nr:MULTISPECIES: hypothetical protein [unclassified Vibrio]PML89284.1 hypothetical protein BCT66_08030 [Vibrio sp. 10N.261.49.E11]PMN80284.1 hypothetical protein BCT25_01845 [Vibrio sp. 10N.261.45.A6]PMN82198.1 hypothetical protein BCT22_13915 [Vibrio sp. 10N.261.45.A1]